MASILLTGKAIRLDGTTSSEKRKEWRPWKKKGYRIPDDDGKTVWHEKEAIRRLVTGAFSDRHADLFLFGSRASGESWAHSDYDVGYWTDQPLTASQLSLLQEELEELPIPANVELVDFRRVPEEFKRIVLECKKIEIWKKRSKNSLFM